MKLLLLQAEVMKIDWTQFGIAGGVIVIVISFLYFVLRIVPTLGSIYERIKTAEIGVREKEADVRAKEAESRIQQATGFSELSASLRDMSGVIKEVVIEQKHATDKAILMSRVNADRSQEMIEMMSSLTTEVALVKEQLGIHENGTQAS